MAQRGDHLAAFSGERGALLRNPAQRGHRFQRKADSIPVIADSR
ncbi:MAG: hypothetical protein WA754_17555 [Pseudolabrys sp.]